MSPKINWSANPSATGRARTGEIGKECFFAALQELHIGEWKKYYDARRFGHTAGSGIQWHLKIWFSDRCRPICIAGDGVYPYNFGRAAKLFKVKVPGYVYEE